MYSFDISYTLPRQRKSLAISKSILQIMHWRGVLQVFIHMNDSPLILIFPLGLLHLWEVCTKLMLILIPRAREQRDS